MEEGADKQEKNREHLKAWQWKKGQSGNVLGRPKGVTLKEYAREFLSKMTEEERDAFMEGLPKEVIWKMAEGNPAQDLTTGGEKIAVIPIIGAIPTDNSNEATGETK